MKRRLSIAALVLCLILLLCGCGEEQGYPAATEEFFVNDFADVIDDSAEKEMLSRAVSLYETTTAQVVTITVESLNGTEPSQYALEIGREWGVGSDEEDNGVVILLSESDREIYIAVGYGLEGALPDSKTGRIIDYYGLEYLKADDFSTGLNEISSAVINEVYIEYGIEPPEGYTSIDRMYQSQSVSSQGGKVLLSWAVMIILLILISLLSRRRGGFIFFPTHFGRFGGGSFGGFSGHSGGSGGFGGFKGGGGSFGGGGAGRGF